MKVNKKDILLLLFLFVLICIDRLTKIFVKEKQINFGGFFGFPLAFYLLFLISLAFIILLIFLYFYEKNFSIRLGLIFLLSGAISNFIDRLMYGGVIDWINFIFFTFNIADIYFWIGLFIFIFCLIKKKS
jgi:signal peptidase II